MKKKRIIPSIAILMVLTAIMIALTGCTTSEKPDPIVQNVYIKEDDNSSDNNAETKMLVELEDEGETELVILSAPNELFDKLGIGKKEKYTQATEEKVKAVLDVLVKELGLSTKTLSQFNEHTTPENSAPAVQNVYIKEDDNSSDNKADTKMFVEFDNEAGTTGITLSVPNELFDKLGIKKKEKYTKATEEKVKAVLNVLAKGYNLNIKALLHRKSVVDKEGEFEIALELFLIIGVIAVVKEAYDEDKKKRKIRAHLRYWKIP